MFETRKIKLNDMEICYIDNYTKDKADQKTLLFVHGWGADKYNLQGIYSSLQHDFRIVSVDLPGFGESDNPHDTIGSIEYADYINEFVKKTGIKQVIYIGHSFGGKIGIITSVKYPELIEKLVLIDSTGIRARRYPAWYFKVYSFKIMKFFLQNVIKSEDSVLKLKERFGSVDYKNAGVMRDIMVKNVSEDFTDYLTEISCPVFIYWGEKDGDTPLWMAKKMNRLIQDSGLYVVKNGGHFSFLDDNRIISIIDNFART